MPPVKNQREPVCRPDECQREGNDDDPSHGLVESRHLVDDRDERGNERALGLEIAVWAAPIDLRVER